VVNERATLEAYREKVFNELRIRTERLREIDGAIASNSYLQGATNSAHALRGGNTIRALAGAASKAKLRRERGDLERKRKQAADDLKRAEERLADVDRELAALPSEALDNFGQDEGG
jgi:chromosome segregation ATPase